MKKPSVKRKKQAKSPAIDFSDIPELTADFWKQARVLRPQQKAAMSIRLDRDVLQWFRKQGRGYQSLMNSVLRTFMEADLR